MDNNKIKLTTKQKRLNYMKQKYAQTCLNNLIQLQSDLIKQLSETDFSKYEEAPKDINKMMKNLYGALNSLQ
jgi:hypothetical protein